MLSLSRFRVSLRWLGWGGFSLLIILSCIVNFVGNASCFLRDILCVLGIVGEFVFLIVFGNVEFGVELKLLSLLE